MKIEDYNEYYIQGSDHYLIPKDVFKELFNEIINWKEQNKILKENAENNDKVVDNVNWENQLLKKENEQLKDNWNKLKQIIDVKMYNSEYLINLCGYKVDVDTLEILKIIKEEMQELEQGSDSNE